MPNRSSHGNSDIFKKYNPNIFGYSVGIGSPNVWDISYLNVAMPGAVAADLPGQARQLVGLLHAHPEVCDIQFSSKHLIFEDGVKVGI